MSVATADPDVEPPTPDDRFAQIAEQVPGFGGAWVEGDAMVGEPETLQLWLIEPSDSAVGESRRLLVEVVGERYNQEAVEVHKADYGWDQLYAWNRKASDLFGPAGAGWMDIDETRNRIVLGIQDPEGQRAAIREMLADLGIPEGAVELEQGGPTPPDILVEGPQVPAGPVDMQWGGLALALGLGTLAVALGLVIVGGLARRRRVFGDRHAMTRMRLWGHPAPPMMALVASTETHG